MRWEAAGEARGLSSGERGLNEGWVLFRIRVGVGCVLLVLAGYLYYRY